MSVFITRSKIEYVFVDWFGVLSTNYYWCIQSQKNDLLKEWCDSVFDDVEVLNQWMRGKYSMKYLANLKVIVDADFLINSFLKDIDYYRPDFILLECISKLFPSSKKILISDNFDLFNYILKEYDLRSYFNKFYLSHETGVLKNDSPNSLFDFAMHDLGLANFNNCLLIDDSETNCEKFRLKGGRTIWVS